MDTSEAERPDAALKHRRSLGPAGSRRRRALHYTRGFLRPVVLGGLIAFLVPAAYAMSVWRTYDDVSRNSTTFAVLDVAAAVVGGAVAALLLPAHPRAGEGGKNAAIAAVAAAGAGYGAAWILFKAAVVLSFGQYLPVEPGTLAHEMDKFLLLGAAVAAIAGVVIGRLRAGTASADV